MLISTRLALVACFALATASLTQAQTVPQDVRVVNSPKVIINNAHNKPVPVYDVHADPGEPFFLEAAAVDRTGLGGVDIELLTVPADCRYVVEHVSADCHVLPRLPITVMRVGIRTPAAETMHRLVPSLVPGDTRDFNFVNTSTPIRIEAGSDARLFFRAGAFAVSPMRAEELRCTVAVSGRRYSAW